MDPGVARSRSGSKDRSTVQVARTCLRALRGRRGSPRTDAPSCGALGLSLRLRESAQVLAKEARGVHQRSERGQILRVGVQTEKIETDTLQRGNAVGEVRLRCRTARSQ